MRGCEIGDDGEDGEVPPGLFGYFLTAEHGNVGHHWMDTDDDVGIVGHDALPHGLLAEHLVAHIKKEFERAGVGEFEDEVPLLRVGREMFVALDDFVVGWYV